MNACKTNQSPIDCAIEYGQNLFPGIFDQETISNIISQATYSALNDSTNYIPEYLSSQGQNYSSQIISMIDNIEESYEIEQVIDDIAELESEISESSLSNTEKKILLYAGSVARHSLNFWYLNIDTSGPSPVAILRYIHDNSSIYIESPAGSCEFFNNEKTSFHIANGSSFWYTNFENWPKKGWLRKLLHVVVGDVVGGLVGAGIGSLLPCGPACIFAGGLFGAMSGSLAVAEYEDML